MTTSLNLKQIQQEIKVWNKKNFPDASASDVLIGVTEELGELKK